jgi:hypothetical protein
MKSLVAERNLRSVDAFYEADRRRDIESWAAFWNERGRHSFCFNTPTEPIEGRDELVRVTRRKFAERPPYSIHVVTRALADPSQVLARLRLTPDANDGDDSATIHVWCLFHFDDAGLITEIEELADNALPPGLLPPPSVSD